MGWKNPENINYYLWRDWYFAFILIYRRKTLKSRCMAIFLWCSPEFYFTLSCCTPETYKRKQNCTGWIRRYHRGKGGGKRKKKLGYKNKLHLKWWPSVILAQLQGKGKVNSDFTGGEKWRWEKSAYDATFATGLCLTGTKFQEKDAHGCFWGNQVIQWEVQSSWSLGPGFKSPVCGLLCL